MHSSLFSFPFPFILSFTTFYSLIFFLLLASTFFTSKVSLFPFSFVYFYWYLFLVFSFPSHRTQCSDPMAVYSLPQYTAEQKGQLRFVCPLPLLYSSFCFISNLSQSVSFPCFPSLHYNIKQLDTRLKVSVHHFKQSRSVP